MPHKHSTPKTPSQTKAPKRAPSPGHGPGVLRRPRSTQGEPAAGTSPAAGPHASGLKLHLGCGPFKLDGWKNYDVGDVDITKPLRFETGSVRYIFAEHLIEHVPYLDAMRFFAEAFRVLEVEGVLRLAFPDVARLSTSCGEELRHLRKVMLSFGHEMAWSQLLMHRALVVAGFEPLQVRECAYGESDHKALRNVEQHGKISRWARAETTILEAQKYE
ncbi:MAG TPA: hypothetical protein VNG33_10105 [Polyangiaceae bacterium]|nr:hypothetical protein [Polyangiaceae bacterium]